MPDPQTEIELQRAQWRMDAFDDRLHAGADTFAKMQQAVDRAIELSLPKPPNPWTVAGKVFGIVVVVSGIAFAAGNYPTRAEWQESQDETRTRLEETSDAINSLKLEQRDLSAGVKMLTAGQDRAEESQKEIDNKLDRVLSKKRR